MQNGFTSKEVNFIKHWVEKESSSWLIIISQLRRAFLGGVFLRLLILFFCLFSVIGKDSAYFYGAIFTGLLSFAIVEVFAPFKVGAKIFFKFKKINN